MPLSSRYPQFFEIFSIIFTYPNNLPGQCKHQQKFRCIFGGYPISGAEDPVQSFLFVTVALLTHNIFFIVWVLIGGRYEMRLSPKSRIHW